MNNIDRMFTRDPVAFAKAYLDYLRVVLERIDTKEIGCFIQTLLDARARGATVFLIGNGGSAATASHMANDLCIGCNHDDMPFRAVALTDNVAVMTAISNDFGYEEIFSRQLKVLGRKGDVLVAISASGNSPNLLKALEYATARKLIQLAELPIEIIDKCEFFWTESGHRKLRFPGQWSKKLIKECEFPERNSQFLIAIVLPAAPSFHDSTSGRPSALAWRASARHGHRQRHARLIRRRHCRRGRRD